MLNLKGSGLSGILDGPANIPLQLLDVNRISAFVSCKLNGEKSMVISSSLTPSITWRLARITSLVQIAGLPKGKINSISASSSSLEVSYSRSMSIGTFS